MKIVPAVEDVRDEMRKTDIVVNATTGEEGFGLTVVEAMAAGALAVAPDAGGPAEIIEHHKTGLLFPRGDTHKLARALRYALENRETALSIRSAGRQLARQYSAKNMVTQLEGHYRELI